MGGGSREYQYSSRFWATGSVIEGGEGEFESFVFGDYKVVTNGCCLYVYYRDRLLSVYDRGSLYKLGVNYIKLRTDKPGILLKISSSGVERVFSIERALLYGLIAGDGYVYLGDKEYNSYIRFSSTDIEVVKAYLSIMKRLYGVEPNIRENIPRRGKKIYEVKI